MADMESAIAEEASIQENATTAGFAVEETGSTGGFAEGQTPQTTEGGRADDSSSLAPTTSPSEEYTLEMQEDSLPLLKMQLDNFTATCREAGLTKAQAERVLAWQKEKLLEVENNTQQQTEMALKSWETELRADPEFGGIRYKRTIADARNALQAFDADGSLRNLLIETHGQFEPSVVRFMSRVGRAIAEGQMVIVGDGGQGKEAPLAERFYGRDGMTVKHGIQEV